MRRLVVLIVSLLVVAAACADDDGSDTEATDTPPATTAAPATTEAPAATSAPTTTAAAPTTTVAPVTEELDLPASVVEATRFSVSGPYRAGVRTIEAADGTVVEVWYPTEDDGEGEVYSLGEWTPELVVAILGDRLPELVSAAVRDATPAEGSFPLALFSHGFGGFRVQSAEIASSLATWGFVVAAPDHDHRGLTSVLVGAAEEGDDTADLVAARDATAADEVVGPIVAEGHVVAFGHSAGARGSAEAVDELGAVAWVGMAPAGPAPDGELVTTVIAGGADAVTDLASVEAGAVGVDWFAVFADAGHQAFSDLCVLRGEPLPDLAADLGFPLPESLTALATDGCETDRLPPTQAAPAIEHLVVATFRSGLGIGDTEAPFAPDLLAEFDELGLTVTAGVDG